MRRISTQLVLTALLIVRVTYAATLDSRKLISQFTHTSWSAKDGIPGPIRAIVQTRDGYLWLGTEAGLYRFDGLRFVEWKSSAGERLPGSSIWSLCAAREGSLWIGLGSSGISRLRDGHLTNFSSREGIPAGGALSIVEDASGSIWAGGQYGFTKYENGVWRRVGAESAYSASGAQALFVDSRGTLWVVTDGVNFGLSKDPVSRNTILSLAAGEKQFRPTGHAVGMVWSMAEAPNGSVWVADTTGRAVRPISGPDRASSGIPVDAEAMSLLFDDDQKLWVGLIEGGIRRTAYLARPTQQTIALDRFAAPDGMSGGLVYTNYKDREGNIWFGTTGGLDQFRINKVTPFSVREGLDPDQQIALTSGPDGSVWVVSYTRDAVRLFRNGTFTTFRLPSYSASDTTRILALFADPSGGAWVGGNFGLARESKGRFSYENIRALERGANIEAITSDARGGLWLAVTIWNPNASTETVHKILRYHGGEWTDFGKRAVFPEYRSRVLFAEPNGRVWFGFEDGEVAVYDAGAVQRFSSSNGLPQGRVLAIGTDRGGHVWVGTEGGLSQFDRGHFATLSQDNGLPGTSVSGIVQDDDGNLWLACSLGIFRVSDAELTKALSSPTYRLQGLTIGPNDGLRGLPRQREPFPTAARASDGRLWFATTNGVAAIDPRYLPRNSVVPPVVIETIKADEHVSSPAWGLQLPPRTRNLEISYAALSLTDPERIQFRYKLDGYDDAWRGPTTARQVTYTNLPPRPYEFRLIASNNDGLWNEAGATLSFTIRPAFYQTNWFWLSSAVLVSWVVWLAYQRRIRGVARQLNLRFEERLAERTRIAQELHDTLLQGFVSASMQLYVATERLPADSPAKSSLGRVADMMRRVIEEGRNAVRGLRSPVASSGDLAEAFSTVSNELVVDGVPDFRVIVEGSRRPINPLIRDDVYRIGHEALVNAFRHAAATRIEIALEYASSGLRMLVRDNGCGIQQDVVESGSEGHWGLSGMRERAGRIGGQLRVWSAASAGSEVELWVPAPTAFTDGRSRGPWRPWHVWRAAATTFRSRYPMAKE